VLVGFVVGMSWPAGVGHFVWAAPSSSFRRQCQSTKDENTKFMSDGCLAVYIIHMQAEVTSRTTFTRDIHVTILQLQLSFFLHLIHAVKEQSHTGQHMH